MKPVKLPPLPPANKDWRYSPPVVAKDGTVWVDAMTLTNAARQYQAFGVLPVAEKKK